MIINTNAIICSKVEWKETSFIYNAFSQKLGYISFIAQGIKNQKNANKDILQLYNEVDLVLFKSAEANVFKMKSVDIINSIPTCIDYKNFVLLNSIFEIIRQVLINPNEIEDIYLYLIKFIKYLDQIKAKHFLYFARFIFQFFEKIHKHFFLFECDLCHKKINSTLLINNSNQLVCHDCNLTVNEPSESYINPINEIQFTELDNNLKFILFHNQAFWSYLDLLDETNEAINQFKMILTKQFSNHFNKVLTLKSIEFYKL